MAIFEIVISIKSSLPVFRCHQHHCSRILPFMEMEYFTKKSEITERTKSFSQK